MKHNKCLLIKARVSSNFSHFMDHIIATSYDIALVSLSELENMGGIYLGPRSDITVKMHGQRSYLVALIGGIHNLSLVRELSKSADRFLPFVISVCMIFVRLCSRSQQLKVKTRRHICNSRHIERYLEPDIVLTRNGGGWGAGGWGLGGGGGVGGRGGDSHQYSLPGLQNQKNWRSIVSKPVRRKILLQSSGYGAKNTM